MFTILGLLIVIGAVIGGYLMEHGQLMVLMQPAELVIIGGTALGAALISNPIYVITKALSNILKCFTPDHYNKKVYLETLKMLFAVFSLGRKQGDQALEAEVENPAGGSTFSTYPAFVKDKASLNYVCDTLRMSLMGGSAHDLDELMEVDAESQQEESAQPVSALQSVADALPGFGIVAAVLGVVITMGALGGPPEEIGHKVAAALVGTFLGILLCYGVVGPFATRLGMLNHGHHEYLMCLRSAVIAYVKGTSPLMAVEHGRRSIPLRIRPGFSDLESACKGGGAPAEAAAAAGAGK
ncbi:MAG: flagellar motor stator protein MotA [Bryobacteraceae bacterium]|nr:flagellar motor stator protein MotA [Bryobacteraceae bacterium]